MSAATCPHENDASVFTWLSFITPFLFQNWQKISILEKICSIHCACSNISVILAMTEFCLMNVNNMLSLNLDEVNIKIQISYNQLCITCRLKSPWSLLSFFLTCYKNNFGYKCLHSTNFISKAASLLSHPNQSTCIHAQISFLIYFCSVTLKDR